MAGHFTIRFASEKDVESIHRIRVTAIRAKCSSHYKQEDINSWAARRQKEDFLPEINACEITVAEHVEDGKILGFGHLIMITSPVKECEQKTLMIKGLFVDPHCGVKGVGSALMKEIEQRARDEEEADILIVEAALNAVEFYKKCGFTFLQLTTHRISEQVCLECHKMVKKL